MSRPYRRNKAPDCRLAIIRTGANFMGYISREDHICDRYWGCSRILYFQTHQNLGLTFRSFDKLLLPTRVCALLMDQMAPTSTTPFTRSARLHRLILQDVPLTSCSRSRRGTHIKNFGWFINSIPSRSIVV
jgi:hypothetical protein